LLVTRAHRFEGYWNVDVLTIAKHLQLDGRTRTLLSNLHLQLAGIADLLAIEFGDHVADFQAALGRG
jgi:hypothetical protein